MLEVPVVPPPDPGLPAALDAPARALFDAIERTRALKPAERDPLVALLRNALDAVQLSARQLQAEPRPSPTPEALALWSHGLREPLTVVVSWIQLLTMALDDRQRTRGREAIERNIRLFVERVADRPA
jgi:hypothetical protein